jgi:hypothetical protein
MPPARELSPRVEPQLPPRAVPARPVTPVTPREQLTPPKVDPPVIRETPRTLPAPATPGSPGGLIPGSGNRPFTPAPREAPFRPTTPRIPSIQNPAPATPTAPPPPVAAPPLRSGLSPTPGVSPQPRTPALPTARDFSRPLAPRTAPSAPAPTTSFQPPPPPQSSLVPSAAVTGHGFRGDDNRDWRRDHSRGDRWRHDAWRRHYDRSPRFYFSFTFGSGWWYRPAYVCDPFYDPWFYRPYRYYSCWDPCWYGYRRPVLVPVACAYPVWYESCDPWVTYRIYGASYSVSTFSFGCGTRITYTYSSCPLIPAARVCEPVWVRPVYVYRPPPIMNITYTYAEPQTLEVPAYLPAMASVESLPAPASASDLLSTSERQLGDTYMRLGDWESAVRVYSEHVARYPGDVEALRSLGIALIAMGQVEAGVTHVERAYRIDPTLAQRHFNASLLNERSLQGILDHAAQRASISNRAEPWLAVAVLMQAQGKHDAARSALDRARELGLDKLVADWMDSQIPVEPQ